MYFQKFDTNIITFQIFCTESEETEKNQTFFEITQIAIKHKKDPRGSITQMQPSQVGLSEDLSMHFTSNFYPTVCYS